MKKILLIGTGGTMTAKTVNGSWKPGSFTEEDLIGFIPEIKELAEIDVIDLFRMDSSDMQPGDWVEIARTIYKNRDKYEGFVITHGTDTMHYTASALSFLLQDLHAPIVITGAQVPPDKKGSDAKRNLYDAVRVASETDIGEVVIVFNTKVIRGNRAKKFREMEFEAFESVGMLPLGIVEHDVRLTHAHMKAKKGGMKFFEKIESNVCIIKMTPGMNPKIISNTIDLGYKGIVLEGFGAGIVPVHQKSLLPEIRNAVEQNIPVILSTQCAIGSAWVYIYENGAKALGAGAIAGHDMISETAMTKLMWILGNFDYKMDKISEIALKNVAGEISDARSPKEKRIWEYPL